jgi:predicted nucleic acid-binding protein
MNLEDLQAAVVDASVGIKLFVLEDDSQQADRLFGRLVTDPSTRFFVPDLFYIECTNILWKYVQRYGYPPENARQDVADLQDLALHDFPTADLVAESLDLALLYGVTAYDASYAALAQRLKLPLVTADQTLAQKLAGRDIDIILLHDLN